MEVLFNTKQLRTGDPSNFADDLKLFHKLPVQKLEIKMQYNQLQAGHLSLEELNKKQIELFEFAPNGYFTLTNKGTIRKVNVTGSNLLRIDKANLLSQLFLNFIHPDDQEIFKVCWFNLIETRNYQLTNIRLSRPDGNQIYVRIGFSIFESKNEFQVLLTMTDVIMQKQIDSGQNEQLMNETIVRKQLEQSLAIAEEKYRAVANYTYNWETWLNPEGVFIYQSPSCLRISCYTVEQFIQDPTLFINIIHPDDRETIRESFSNLQKDRTSEWSGEFRIITGDGEVRWIGHYCQPVYDANGKFLGHRGSNSDITKRKKQEDVLLDSQKRLRQLTQRIIAITEEERIRIAREIHDELGHLLTAMKYDIDELINQADLSVEQAKNELGIMMGMIDSLIDSVRKIATELRPGILDHLGLFPAIEWQIRQFRMRSKICCVFNRIEIDVIFDKEETTSIYRILQEILTNITRHSKANHVKIILTKNEDHFILKVMDNGVGFDPDGSNNVNSLGLMGMQERALSIGGELQIESSLGQGTTITFILPKVNAGHTVTEIVNS